MAVSFLHGIESVEVTLGPLPVTIVRSAVIGLVGTAPTWAAPAPTGKFAPTTRGAWKASTLFLVGQRIVDSAGNLQAVSSAGTTSGGAPAWSMSTGALTIDGGVTWTCLGPFTGYTIPEWCQNQTTIWPLWNPASIFKVGDCVIDYNGNVQKCNTAGTSGVSEPTWATTLNAPTSGDGGCAWTLVQTARQLGQTNQLGLVNGVRDTALWGPLVRGYTIPYSLSQIQAQGSGQVVVVNVFDRTQHRVGVTRAPYTVPASQVIDLGHKGVSEVSIEFYDLGTQYICGQDFSVDTVNGRVKMFALEQGTDVVISYKWADPTATVNSHGMTDLILGLVDSAGATPALGTYYGLQLLPLAFGRYGYKPKILIAPGYSNQKTVADALDAMAYRLRAISYVDQNCFDFQPSFSATEGVQAVLGQRGSSANTFGMASKRTELLYPNLLYIDQGVDPAGGVVPTESSGPMSAWRAGVRAATDINFGYWWSDSNQPIRGALAPDFDITMSAFDSDADTQQLNAAGISTVLQSYGTGLRTFGNRSSAYPASTAPDQFVCIRRALDVFEDAIEQFSLQYLDGPITNARIQAVLDATNAFVHTMIQRGAFTPGSYAFYDPNENPPSELAAGHVTFSYDVMPPPPMERITHKVQIDIGLLKNIGPQQQTVAQ